MGEGRAPLHFWETGEGPPLVLVHGGLSNGLLAWSRTAEALSAYHRLIVVDRRGHGKSPRLPRPYTIASDARDLVQLAAALGLERLHLAGHSYGALVAYEMAVRTPQAVASLHLIEPPMLTIAADVPEVQALIRRSLDLWRGRKAPVRSSPPAFWPWWRERPSYSRCGPGRSGASSWQKRGACLTRKILPRTCRRPSPRRTSASPSGYTAAEGAILPCASWPNGWPTGSREPV